MEEHFFADGQPQSRWVVLWKRLQQLVDYLFFLLYGGIGLQFILELAGASNASGFKQFLNWITYPFLNPFAGLFPDPHFREHYRFRITYLVALSIYLLLHLAVMGLFRLFKNKQLS
jgi:uncharacterized protein YggT (Ycf19 family)